MREDPVVRRSLERLGIPPEGVLLVHGAFRALGSAGHELDPVLAALVRHMEPGTLLMPAMSWRFVTVDNPVFDELATPANTGALSERFRVRFATSRSIHPTHSVAGMGRLAASILGSHHLDDTPCSARSPFGMLAEHDGWVLLLGCGMDSCTLVHHVEEMLAADTYLHPPSERQAYCCRKRSGQEIAVHVRHHRRLARNFFQFQDRLAEEGNMRVARIDHAILRAFKAEDMVRAVADRLREDPTAILARPGDRFRMM